MRVITVEGRKKTIVQYKNRKSDDKIMLEALYKLKIIILNEIVSFKISFRNDD